jgi:predicted ribosomally synthesized peptide with SipW-like signal peptide
MKNIWLSVIVVAVLVSAGVGGTFAGFVDTEESKGNYIQAGIMDLLVNGKNDPVGPKLVYTHAVPCVSQDFWIDIFNWGECQGATAYMHIKNVDSVEWGQKLHDTIRYVYKETSAGVFEYVAFNDPEPQGSGVWSSEPEKISEVGDGMVGQIYIRPDDANLLGEDYASGIADHLDVLVVTYVNAQGFLVDIDDDGDGVIQDDEEAAHASELVTIFSGKLKDIECVKKALGFLPTQQYGWIHVDVHLQQIEAYETDPDTGEFLDPGTPSNHPWPEPQRKWWPTNALQGDYATWDMLFELTTD